ncbi:hypothetical protein CYMTET_53094 [Cymbomonas tetramitiformis]|uniref:Uncharacterized protein n=1 Tax=Cymbomonas tetramitiformis TaxID=36881 RepID=A0AAE0EQP5_9CHLO|nr:hypothetical protein CYMTET_53094 [Cymbomonas tetramitiformis]
MGIAHLMLLTTSPRLNGITSRKFSAQTNGNLFKRFQRRQVNVSTRQTSAKRSLRPAALDSTVVEPVLASSTVFEPQVDGASLIGTLAVVAVLSLVQLRANAANKARAEVEELTEQLQSLRVKKLSGELSAKDIDLVEEEIAVLKEREEAAKTLTEFMGLSFRIVTAGTRGEKIEEDGPSDGGSVSSVILNVATIFLTLLLLILGTAITTMDPIGPPPAGVPYIEIVPNE